MIGYSASRGFSATLEFLVATVKHITQWTRHVTRSHDLHWSYGVRRRQLTRLRRRRKGLEWEGKGGDIPQPIRGSGEQLISRNGVNMARSYS